MDLKEQNELQERKIRLFEELLTLQYENGKVKIEKGRWDTLVVSEPDQTDVLYHAFGIMTLCEIVGLTAMVAKNAAGNPVIVIS